MSKQVPEALRDFPLAGLFSAALKLNGLSITSGTLPNLTEDGKIASPGDLPAQFHEALSNALGHLIKCDHETSDTALALILTTEPVDDTEEGRSNYAAINTVWSGLMGERPETCRIAFQVKGLPKGALVEIFALASK